MGRITFDDEVTYRSRGAVKKKVSSGIAPRNVLLRLGVKEKYVNAVLLVVVAVSFLYLFSSSVYRSTGAVPQKIEYREDVPEEMLLILPADTVNALPSRHE